MGRGLFPPLPISTYASILFSPPRDRHEALPLSPLGHIPREWQMEKAHGCRALTEALLNPTLRAYGGVTAP